MEGEGTPSDASSFIYLAKTDSLDLAVAALGGSLLATPAVWSETVEAGRMIGAAEVPRIEVAENGGLIQRIELSPEEANQALELRATYRLGGGESQALVVTPAGGRVLVDEGRATRVAAGLGLVPGSTLFLPALAARGGALGETEAIAWLRDLAVVTSARADVLVELEDAVRKENQ